MNFTLTLRLEHFCLIKIAATLWNKEEIREIIVDSAQRGILRENTPLVEEELDLGDMIAERIPELSLPQRLEEAVIGYTKPVGDSIKDWILRIKNKLNCNDARVILPRTFSWTLQGVDQKKTAEMLVKDESLDIPTRYKLACHFCLDADVFMLWNKMPENCRTDFHEVERNWLDVNQDELVVLWTCIVKEEAADGMDTVIGRWKAGVFRLSIPRYLASNKNRSPYLYAFEHAARSGNKAATDYFLQKLSLEESEKSLIISEHLLEYHRNGISSYPVVFHSLLSRLNEEHQTRVCKTIPYCVLMHLLSWPLQGFFMETANCVWDSLEKVKFHFTYILLRMIQKLEFGYKDWEYRKLFGEFWDKSPLACKIKVFNDQYLFRRLVEHFYFYEDEENIELIFQYATPEQKEEYSRDNLLSTA